MNSRMRPMIYLYRGDGSLYPKAPPFFSVVLPVLERITGRKLSSEMPEILVYPIPMEPHLAGSPAITNVSYNYGYARVRIYEGGRVVYEHPHTIKELVAEPLQALLGKLEPTEKHWGFYLYLEGMPPPYTAVKPMDQVHTLVTDNKPNVEGVVNVTPYQTNERPLFGIKRVVEDPLPLASLDDFRIITHAVSQSSSVKVLVHESVYEEMHKTRHFSHKVEEGGFLVGKVYEDADARGTYFVEVTAALTAEHTGASLLHFTYTGDSFSAFNTRLRQEYQSQRLVGWYHTHLFAATDKMGLSSIDLDLHFSTFRQPWQLAGLINLDAPGRRTLRFYVKEGSLMMPCPQWIIQ